MDLSSFCKDLGFADFGITKLSIPQSHQEHYLSLFQKKLFGDMGYLSKNINCRILKNPSEHSHCLVFLYPYHYKNQKADFGNFKIARYAQGEDYHFILKHKLQKIEKFLQKNHSDISTKIVVDTAPYPERSLGYMAGLGWIGKNSLLINKSLGSYTLIGLILLSKEIPLESKKIYDISYCGSCTKCIDACPTNAITPQKGLIPNKCISYLNNEKRTSANLFGWAVGCDICQEVCPWNKKETSILEAPESWQVDQELQEKLEDYLSSKKSFRSLFKTKAFFRIGATNFLKILSQIQKSIDMQPAKDKKKSRS